MWFYCFIQLSKFSNLICDGKNCFHRFSTYKKINRPGFWNDGFFLIECPNFSSTMCRQADKKRQQNHKNGLLNLVKRIAIAFWLFIHSDHILAESGSSIQKSDILALMNSEYRIHLVYYEIWEANAREINLQILLTQMSEFHNSK